MKKEIYSMKYTLLIIMLSITFLSLIFISFSVSEQFAIGIGLVCLIFLATSYIDPDNIITDNFQDFPEDKKILESRSYNLRERLSVRNKVDGLVVASYIALIGIIAIVIYYVSDMSVSNSLKLVTISLVIALSLVSISFAISASFVRIFKKSGIVINENNTMIIVRNGKKDKYVPIKSISDILIEDNISFVIDDTFGYRDVVKIQGLSEETREEIRDKVNKYRVLYNI